MISQNALQSFQDEMGKVLNDPYKVFQMDSHFSRFNEIISSILKISNKHLTGHIWLIMYKSEYYFY